MSRSSLATLLMTIILLGSAAASYGHCGLDRSRLDPEQRRRVDEWDRMISDAQDLVDLFEKGVNAVICSQLAESAGLSFTEHVECVLQGPSDAFQKIADRQRAALLLEESKARRRAIDERHQTDERRRDFLWENGWGPYLQSVEDR